MSSNESRGNMETFILLNYINIEIVTEKRLKQIRAEIG